MASNIHKQRLLNVAKALRESPNPDRFTMDSYAYDCQTPACAWGHYAARTDLQDEFAIAHNKRDERAYIVTVNGRLSHYNSEHVLEHLGITFAEAGELFSSKICGDDGGCGNAQTATEAAEYIEAFAARKWGTDGA